MRGPRFCVPSDAYTQVYVSEGKLTALRFCSTRCVSFSPIFHRRSRSCLFAAVPRLGHLPGGYAYLAVVDVPVFVSPLEPFSVFFFCDLWHSTAEHMVGIIFTIGCCQGIDRFVALFLSLTPVASRPYLPVSWLLYVGLFVVFGPAFPCRARAVWRGVCRARRCFGGRRGSGRVGRAAGEVAGADGDTLVALLGVFEVGASRCGRSKHA